jgi:hypothetical protein
MRRQIKLRTRKELTAAISQRYKNTDRKSKKLILDEFIKVTGYHRKHAIRILTAPPVSLGMPAAPSKSRIYGEAVKEALIVLWEAADRICGKRLKVLLPQLVEAMERHRCRWKPGFVLSYLPSARQRSIDSFLQFGRRRMADGKGERL